MSGHQAIVAILKADAGVQGAVGQKVFPDLVPQGTDFPAVTFIRVGGQRKRRSRTVSKVLKERFQITAIAKTREQALAVAEKVRVAMIGVRGVIGGVNVRGCWCEDEGQDLSDPDTKLRLVAADYRIWTSAP